MAAERLAKRNSCAQSPYPSKQAGGSGFGFKPAALKSRASPPDLAAKSSFAAVFAVPAEIGSARPLHGRHQHAGGRL